MPCGMVPARVPEHLYAASSDANATPVKVPERTAVPFFPEARSGMPDGEESAAFMSATENEYTSLGDPAVNPANEMTRYAAHPDGRPLGTL